MTKLDEMAEKIVTEIITAQILEDIPEAKISLIRSTEAVKEVELTLKFAVKAGALAILKIIDGIVDNDEVADDGLWHGVNWLAKHLQKELGIE